MLPMDLNFKPVKKVPDDGTDAPKHIAHLSVAFYDILVMSIKFV